MSAGTGLLVVISGPSGVGKTTVAAALREREGFERAVTATTRPRRVGEEDGVDYHFLDRARFEADRERGRFLETAVVHGELYGTPKNSVRSVIERGEVCVLVIDVQGAATLRDAGEGALFVFLSPPTAEELVRRLTGRASDSAEQVERRLEEARRELARQDEFDAAVINDDLGAAIEQIRRLVLARLGRTRT